MVEQREQIAQAPLGDGPQTPSMSAFLDTLQRARNSEGDERVRLAGELITLLERPPGEAEQTAWGQFLIDRLDDLAFHDLYDAEGVSCRAVAVEVVLSLGFPYALHLQPTDLEYLRAVKPARSPGGTWQAMAVVTGVLAALFALAFFIQF